MRGRGGRSILFGAVSVLAAEFVFARIQGGFVPWFIFDFTLVLALYETLVWWLGARSLRVERQIATPRVAAGQSIEVTLRVERRGWWPVLWLRISEQLPAGLAIEGSAEWLLVPLWSRESTVTYTLSAVQRGVYDLGPVVVETGDLFGLLRRGRAVRCRNRIVVFPRVLPVARLTGRQPEQTGQQPLAQRRAEETTQLIGVRDWVPGDRLNRVHWPTSARHGKLQAKEFEVQTAGDWVFIPDLTAASYTQGPEGFELAMVITASLLRHAYNARWPAELWLTGERRAILPATQTAALHLQAMEALAAAAPTGKGAFTERLSELTGVRAPGTTLVLVSPAVPPTAAALMEEVRRLHRVEWFVPCPPGMGTGQAGSSLRALAAAGVRVHLIRDPAELRIQPRGGAPDVAQGQGMA